MMTIGEVAVLAVGVIFLAAIQRGRDDQDGYFKLAAWIQTIVTSVLFVASAAWLTGHLREGNYWASRLAMLLVAGLVFGGIIRAVRHESRNRDDGNQSQF